MSKRTKTKESVEREPELSKEMKEKIAFAKAEANERAKKKEN